MRQAWPRGGGGLLTAARRWIVTAVWLVVAGYGSALVVVVLVCTIAMGACVLLEPLDPGRPRVGSSWQLSPGGRYAIFLSEHGCGATDSCETSAYLKLYSALPTLDLGVNPSVEADPVTRVSPSARWLDATHVRVAPLCRPVPRINGSVRWRDVEVAPVCADGG